MNVDRRQKVDAQLRNKDINGAIHDLEQGLIEIDDENFNILVGANFSNQPSAVLSKISEFAAHCDNSFNLGAIYLEMNGFDINHDRWFFDFFGYDQYG